MCLSNNFTRIQSYSQSMWQFQRYTLVYEYFFKPLLPAPFELFSMLFLILKWFVRTLLKNWFTDVIKSENKIKKLLYNFSKPIELGFSNF